MKKETWVVVASASQARVYKIEKNALDAEILSLEHPESRLLEQDLVGSGPGRTFDRFGPGRHAVEPPITQKKTEFALFAKEIATALEAARTEGRLERFYLVAAPTFLGLLRQALSARTLKLLGGEVGKDLLNSKPKEIREYLPPVL